MTYIFVTNNHAPFRLWQKKKMMKYYDHVGRSEIELRGSWAVVLFLNKKHFALTHRPQDTYICVVQALFVVWIF